MRIDGITFVLIQAEIAEYEIGHRLVEVAEEQHLAAQVLVAAQQLNQALVGAQALKVIRVRGVEQHGFQLRAPEFFEVRIVAMGGQQLGAGEQR